jgi:hypothetical protein
LRFGDVRRHVLAVAWRLGVVLAVLTLFYLGVANLILGGGFIARFTEKSDDIRIDYDSAYSVWPGRVVVRNLRVRMEDHNIQFWILVESGFLDISLHELLQKRVHALRVDGENVTYRMRHKLSRVGKEGPRVAAYPPIPGFADPPLFVGPPGVPIPDSEYDLWDVRIDNVTAHVKEIWVLEYRYRGAGVARGTFRVQPARYYEVTPASLELAGGKLTLGDTVVAERADARIDVTVTGSETQKLEGLEPLKHISASAQGRFAGTDFRFLNAYLGPHQGWTATGRGDIELAVRVDKGRIAPGTRLVIASTEASLDLGRFRVRGAPAFSLTGSRAPAESMELRVRAPRLELEADAGKVRSPVIEGLDFRLATSSDLSEPIKPAGAKLEPLHGAVPDLAWFAKAMTLPAEVRELRGHGDFSLEGKSEHSTVWVGKGGVRVASATARIGERATRPIDATLLFPELRANTAETHISGSAQLHVADVAALLPLVSPSAFLRSLEQKLLALGALDASASFAAGDLFRLDRVEAQSGVARVHGHLLVRANGPDGAFLLTTPAVNLGVRVTPQGTTTKPLVGDDWLKENAPAGATSRAQRDKTPRFSD